MLTHFPQSTSGKSKKQKQTQSKVKIKAKKKEKKSKKQKAKEKQKKRIRKALRKVLRGTGESHGTASVEPGIMTTEEIRIPWRPYRPHHRTQGTGVARLPGAYQTAHCRKGTGSQSHWSPGSRS